MGCACLCCTAVHGCAWLVCAQLAAPVCHRRHVLLLPCHPQLTSRSKLPHPQAAKFLTGGSFDYQWLVDESMENLPLGGCKPLFHAMQLMPRHTTLCVPHNKQSCTWNSAHCF